MAIGEGVDARRIYRRRSAQDSKGGLRHSFGIHASPSGVPLKLVQRWLGHASMTTTAIYLDALDEEEREIAARANRMRPSKGGSAAWTRLDDTRLS